MRWQHGPAACGVSLRMYAITGLNMLFFPLPALKYTHVETHMYKGVCLLFVVDVHACLRLCVRHGEHTVHM